MRHETVSNSAVSAPQNSSDDTLKCVHGSNPQIRRVSETPTPTDLKESAAVHLQFVRQYAARLYRCAFLASKPWRKGNPTVHLPFVRQYFWESTGGWGHRKVPDQNRANIQKIGNSRRACSLRTCPHKRVIVIIVIMIMVGFFTEATISRSSPLVIATSCAPYRIQNPSETQNIPRILSRNQNTKNIR